MSNGTFTFTHKTCGDFTKYLVNDENFTDVSSSWKVTLGGGTYGPTKQSLSGTNWIGRKESYIGENSGIRRWPFSCKRNKK